MRYRLGIDVGGTNTDAAILDEAHRVVAKTKAATTSDVSSGIGEAVGRVLALSTIPPADITNAMLGTTHATNAIVERKGLSRVGVIRLAAPSGFAIPPFIEWPRDLLDALGCPWVIVKGGYEYNGVPLSKPDRDEIRRALETIAAKRIEALAVSGVFSPISDEQEMLVEELAREALGKDFPVTRSREIGSIGLIERENAAVLNAAIRGLARKAYGAFQNVLATHGIRAELFITQNDGTLMSIEHAKRYPVLTIASGPTNSLRGAAFLSGMKNAIVVDVGGTTTDVGVLTNGFPRESSSAVQMGGVRTNFRMPDLVSIGLGGGSRGDLQKDPPAVGPRSVGFRITSDALVFGGKTLTATDVAVAGGRASLGDASRVRGVDARRAQAALAVMKAMVEEQIDRMKTSAEGLPVILVGGGSILLPDRLQGASTVSRPEHFEVANAIGAAIAQVSGAVDAVFDTAGKGREKVLEEVKAAAVAEAVRAGADAATVTVVEVEELPLAYLPANTVRFKVKAVGDLKRA